MKELGPRIESLTKKTESLILVHKQTAARLAIVEGEKVRLERKVDGLNEELQRLIDENKVLRMASAIKGDEESVSESKRRISQMVREIDRCIALLND